MPATTWAVVSALLSAPSRYGLPPVEASLGPGRPLATQPLDYDSNITIRRPVAPPLPPAISNLAGNVSHGVLTSGTTITGQLATSWATTVTYLPG